jgi:hypothetical protein
MNDMYFEALNMSKLIYLFLQLLGFFELLLYLACLMPHFVCFLPNPFPYFACLYTNSL